MESAPIRYKNPGAMWGRTGKRPSADREVPTNNPLAMKWGSSQTFYLADGLGQGNNIAVFPTFVQGICAQLDLWRTSKNYKNKRLADALHTWSGGNETESYIAFVTKRVPGLTRDTVMNDVFWKSPSGVAFLKAQAWHEAGKPYPAPDADWIEAQRRVFAGDISTPAPKPMAKSVVPGDPDVWSVQQRLKAMLYHSGEPDGLWGGLTAGAITAFINDRRRTDINAPTSMAEFRTVKEQVEAELAKAEVEHFTRPIAPARAEATADTLAPKLPEVKAAQRASFYSKIQGWWSAAFGGVGAGGVVTNLMTAKETVDPIRAWFGDTVPYVIGGIFVLAVVVIAVVLAKKASGAANESADQSAKAYNEGARV